MAQGAMAGRGHRPSMYVRCANGCSRSGGRQPFTSLAAVEGELIGIVQKDSQDVDHVPRGS